METKKRGLIRKLRTRTATANEEENGARKLGGWRELFLRSQAAQGLDMAPPPPTISLSKRWVFDYSRASRLNAWWEEEEEEDEMDFEGTNGVGIATGRGDGDMTGVIVRDFGSGVWEGWIKDDHSDGVSTACFEISGSIESTSP